MQPWQFLLVILTGWLNRQQQEPPRLRACLKSREPAAKAAEAVQICASFR
jgi:hypothetical protein